MNKKAVAVLFFACLPLVCHADRFDTLVQSNNAFSISYLKNRIDYIEPDPSGTMDNGYLDKENGNQNGLQLAFKSQRRLVNSTDDLYVEGRFTHVAGQTLYQGHLQSFFDPSYHPDYATTTDDRINEAMLRIGLSRFNEDQILATSYLQYDYRDWDRSMEGPSGYKEAYMHHALGFGMRFQESPAVRWVFTEELGYSRTLHAHMETVNFNSGNYDTLKLGGGNVYHLGLAGDCAVSRHVHLTAGYDIQHFTYGHSGEVDGIMEPDSRTALQRIKFGVAYAF